MKVHVIRGSGFLGVTVIPLLIAARHEPTALARSTAAAERVSALGRCPFDLDDPASVTRPSLSAARGARQLGFPRLPCSTMGPHVDGFQAWLLGVSAVKHTCRSAYTGMCRSRPVHGFGLSRSPLRGQSGIRSPGRDRARGRSRGGARAWGRCGAGAAGSSPTSWPPTSDVRTTTAARTTTARATNRRMTIMEPAAW